MSHFFTPHMEILPAAQKQLWPHLQMAAKLGFVLYGGTAIALRLGHRTSVDFDFFTEKPLDKPLLQTAFPFVKKAQLLQDQLNTLTLLISPHETSQPSIKVSFFGEISFGRVGKPEITNDGILQVASLDDLMATKTKVILQRIEMKDYQDLAAMLKFGVDLAKGLASAKSMFGHIFQPSESLKAMVYFKGGDLENLSLQERETLIHAASQIRELPMSKIIAQELALPM